jgi:hypothetical protein
MKGQVFYSLGMFLTGSQVLSADGYCFDSCIQKCSAVLHSDGRLITIGAFALLSLH